MQLRLCRRTLGFIKRTFCVFSLLQSFFFQVSHTENRPQKQQCGRCHPDQTTRLCCARLVSPFFTLKLAQLFTYFTSNSAGKRCKPLLQVKSKIHKPWSLDEYLSGRDTSSSTTPIVKRFQVDWSNQEWRVRTFLFLGLIAFTFSPCGQNQRDFKRSEKNPNLKLGFGKKNILN